MSKTSIWRKFGAELIKRGEDILISTFKIEFTGITYKNLSGIINEKLNLHFPLRDEVHYLTDFQTWAELIEFDWTNKRDYLVDKRDCDDYAEKFSANMSWLYGLNSAFPISVELLNPETGKHISYHRAVLIVTDDNKLYMYDPMEGMKDGIILIKDKDNIIIKNWRYRPRVIRS